MSKSITGLSTEEAQLLAALAGEGKEIFTVRDASEHWQGDPHTAVRLSALEAKGWLERLERGKYLIVPLEAGPEREWTENGFVLAMHMVQPAAIAYWSALHHWNLTEQVPRVVFVQSTGRKFRRRTEVLGIRFRFVTVVPRKFFGFLTEFLDHRRITFTDREKTLLDCLDRLDLAGGIVTVIQALRTGADMLEWNRVDEYLERMGVGAVVKRLGFLVEVLGLDIPDRENRLARWAEGLAAGLSVLDPSSPREPHRIVTRWRVRVNIDEVLLGRRA